MGTIILDSNALFQIMRSPVLEQALLSTGQQIAITNYGLDEVPDNFLSEFRDLQTRLNIQEIDIGNVLAEDTPANRALGAVYGVD